MTLRANQRSFNEIREFEIKTGVNRYAEGSAFIKMGHTHILCTASVEESVANWLKEKNQGWVTAEYSMLPRSTHTRTRRDREKVSGRTQEIQRLIGRALRAMVDLKKLGPRTITIDCDVIQADGGTRTAAINGGCVALALAIDKLVKAGKIPQSPIIDTVSAISVGMKSGQVLVDLDYVEDSSCDVDMNFVMTGTGKFVELQGTAEHVPFSSDDLTAMQTHATAALQKINALQKSHFA